MQFPAREIEIVGLAQDLARGLATNPEVFTSPPPAVLELDEALAAYHAAREENLRAQARARAGTKAKNKALEYLVARLQSGLRYAESVANGDPDTLGLVGWGTRRKRTRSGVPGQVLELEVRKEGPGWVELAWLSPFDGGPVSAYRIQRRRLAGGDWIDVGTAVETSVTLKGQETGVELEYRVLAVNGAGEGSPSNLVRVVL